MLVKYRQKAPSWLAVLDVVASLFCLFSLSPMAAALPAIASQGQPVADGLWFTAILGGAFLLLAGGAKMLLRQASSPIFVSLYAALIAILGALRLQRVGFYFLMAGSLVMGGLVAGLLILFRRPRIWVIAGASWCALVLGIFSVEATRSFLSTETQQFSFYLPLIAIACVLVTVLLVIHFRYGDATTDEAPIITEEK